MSRRAGVELGNLRSRRGFATKASLPRRRRPFHFFVADASFAGGFSLPTRTEFGLRPGANSALAARGIGFDSGMHFGYYLMMAALGLMGLEVLYALYQLATFL